MNRRGMDEENIFNNSSSEDKKLFVLSVHPREFETLSIHQRETFCAHGTSA